MRKKIIANQYNGAMHSFVCHVQSHPTRAIRNVKRAPEAPGSRIISGPRSKSENEFLGLRKARQRLDRGIEEDVFREGAVLADEDGGAGRVAVALDRDQ